MAGLANARAKMRHPLHQRHPTALLLHRDLRAQWASEGRHRGLGLGLGWGEFGGHAVCIQRYSAGLRRSASAAQRNTSGR
jgi:hypothetical protein